MFRLAVYGKGGVGKSTISSNISYALSLDGSRVLHVGCDPKHDSTRLLTHGKSIRTFSSDMASDPVVIGINDIACVECGGADPGRGCAGKGMELLFSRIADVEADYRVCDVLGDVVCGGFSIPARESNCDGILIVTSGEFMSLFAANNILRGLENINPGESVIGIVFNRRGDEGEEDMVRAFSDATGIPIVCDMPRSGLFQQSELDGEVLCYLFPDSKESKLLFSLTDLIVSGPRMYRPRSLSEDAMSNLAAGRPIRDTGKAERRRSCSFEGYDSERNLTYLGDFVMPSCTSHGAADAAMRIRDAAVILHGPRNCAYMMEFAYKRRVLHDTPDRSRRPSQPGMYSTSLDADEAFRETGELIERTVLRAKADGYEHMFLIPTCASEIMAVDLPLYARELGSKHGVDLIPVAADQVFLGSKFGGAFGLMDAMISRMTPRKVEKGTVNLVMRWFYGLGRDRNMAAIQHLLSKYGLRIRLCFLDFTTMEEIEDFCASEYDIQIGHTAFNRRISERIVEVTGRRRPLELDTPIGMEKCLEWIRRIPESYPKLAPMRERAEASLKEEYDSLVRKYRPSFEGRKVVIYCEMVRDLKSQVDVLKALGADVRAILFTNGFVIDHNVRIPDYGEGIEVREGARMCDLRALMSGGDIDLVITNDPDRVAREGFRWASLGSRYYAMDGIEDWMRIMADSMKVGGATWEKGL